MPRFNVAVVVMVVPTMVAVDVKSVVEVGTDTVATKFFAAMVEFEKVKPATALPLFPQNWFEELQVVVTDVPNT